MPTSKSKATPKGRTPARRSTPAKSTTAKTRAKAKATPAKGKAKAATPAPKGSPIVGTLGIATVHVTDYARSLTFFKDTLGFPTRHEMPEGGWFEVQAGPLSLGFHADPGRMEHGAREPGTPTGLYFQVPDVDAAVRELRTRGVKIVDEPEDLPFGRSATFHDPDGNTFALVTWPK
jgi:predicted enzyme related to lactoylglutathione lyase